MPRPRGRPRVNEDLRERRDIAYTTVQTMVNPLLAHLVKDGSFSDKERRALQRIVDEGDE